MAWSDPGDFTSGQILTAAQMDAVREAMFFGQATFTNEAARDAAIPATGITLQEGMRAYLTAPTVPAATGTNTYVPSGITTVYNGTNWTCITPTGANTNAAGTTTSTTYTATLSGSPGTNPSVTLVTGTTALVSITLYLTTSLVAGTALASVAVSGATTIAATDNVGVMFDISTSNYAVQASWVGVIGGLTAGTNTFTMQYRTSGGTATFQRRNLTVQGIA
jgi:hypothetical protein